MENTLDITNIEEVLTGTAYGDLSTKFEELGVGHVWKGGIKKVDLIKEALKELTKIKELVKENVEDIPKELKLQEAEEQDVVEQELVKELEEKDSPTVEVEKTVETQEDATQEETPKYSKEVIEKNLKTIKSNLKNKNPAQKNILLKKKAYLEGLLAEME